MHQQQKDERGRSPKNVGRRTLPKDRVTDREIEAFLIMVSDLPTSARIDEDLEEDPEIIDLPEGGETH